MPKTIATIVFVFGMYAGQSEAQKVVVGVTQIDAAAQNISCEGWDNAVGHDCNQNLTAGFMVMLETAIVKSGKMDVMERGRMNDLLGEQLYGEAGLTDTGGEIGGLTGVDYLVYGAITKFGARQSGFSASPNRGVGSLVGGKARQALGGGFSSNKLTTEMAVDLKVTDVSTGRIVIADSVAGEIQSGKGFSIGGIQRDEASADPFADVQRVVASKITEKIVTERFPFKVIKVQDDGTLILNYGDVFLAPGDHLTLFEVGESFVDPDTGETLGSEETEVGLVEITRSEPRFSRARLLGGSAEVRVGSVLKRATQEGKKSGRKRSGGKFPDR